MKWMNSLQRKFGRNAGIPNLLFLVSMLQLLVFFSLDLFANRNIDLYALLSFNKTLIFQGEVWRLISYIIIPFSLSLPMLIFELYVQCIIGHYLEEEWGSLGLTLFYFIGVLLTSLGGLISGVAMTQYISMSMFLAVAIMWPQMEFLLFFIIPIKAKYLGYIDWAFFAYTVIFAAFSIKISAILALGNLFLFFGNEYIVRIKNYFHYRKQRKNFKDQMK